MKKIIVGVIIFVISFGYVGSAYYYPTLKEQFTLDAIYKQIDNLFLVNKEKAEALHKMLLTISEKKDILTPKKQFILDKTLAYTTHKIFERTYEYDDSTQKFVTDNHGYRNSHYIPNDLVELHNSETIILGYNQLMISFRAYLPLLQLAEEYKKQFNEPLLVMSVWRSYEEQEELQKSRFCKKEHRCAKPGFSEHQSGLAIDIGGLKDERYEWMRTHAYIFGFHQSYQYGENHDNYQEEDRHRRYLGVDFATYLYETGQTFTQWYLHSKSNNNLETSL